MTGARQERVAHARSLLFVPGNRPERFAKAAASGADAIVLDLEDSVPATEKAVARASVRAQWMALQSLDVPLVVRINEHGTDAGRDDLLWLAGLPQSPDAIMVSKAASRQSLEQVHATCAGVAILPLIESATGYAALSALASAVGVLRLVVGHIDFMADTGIVCDEDESELAPLRFTVCMATRLHGLASAVDGVTVALDDAMRLQADVLRAMRMGFGGKLCIHPSQVEPTHVAFMPSARELAWAHQVLQADATSGGAAVQVDGRMVDVPVVLQARRTVARAVGRSRPIDRAHAQGRTDSEKRLT